MKHSRRFCEVPLVFISSLLLVLAAAGSATAATQVHVSTDNYYTAGTRVSVSYDAWNAGSFNIGNTSGDILWEVTEKGWWDTSANQTIISYTVFNDSYTADITSVHVPVPVGIIAASLSAPTGWTAAQIGNELVWRTTGTGIPQFESLDTMIVKYNGLYPIGFLPYVGVDFPGTNVTTSANWVVTSVPEPATLCLLALGGLTMSRRRR